MNDTPSYEDQGFFLDGGAFVKSLTVSYRPDGYASRKVAIVTNEGDVLSLPVALATTLVIDLVTAMYDNGTLSMEAAERVAGLCQSVLVDREDTVCPNCGGNGATGYAYDPDTCQACRGTGRISGTEDGA